MNRNEKKKYLYRERPKAFIQTPINIKGVDYKVYRAFIDSTSQVVEFNIPLKESDNFNDTEPAQLLIRWLI